jgi:hypothetical protein
MAAPATLAKTAAAVAVRGANPAGAAIADGVIHHLIWGKVAAILAMLVGIGGIAGAGVVGMKLLVDGPVTPVRAPETPASMASFNPAGVTTGRLADGVSISILGIHGEIYSPTGWWQANGDQLAVAPCVGMQYRPFNSTGNSGREVVLQINRAVQGLPDPATVEWNIENSMGWSQRRIEGPNPSNAEGAVVAVRDNPHGVVLDARVAAGRWTTIGGRKSDGSIDAPPGRTGVLVGEPFAVGGNVRVQVAYVDPTSIGDFRLVAQESQDRQTTLPLTAFVMTKGTTAGWSATANVADVAEYSAPINLSDIRELEFQTRPFDEFIEIRNVSMRLNQKTTPQVSTSDGTKTPPVVASTAPTVVMALAQSAAGPWTTLYTMAGNGRNAESTSDGGLIAWGSSYTFVNETHKIVMFSGAGNPGCRLVAVGIGGRQEVAAVREATNMVDRIGVQTRIAEYSVKMPVKSVQQWLFQVRSDAAAH